jgi:hypothetical protein
MGRWHGLLLLLRRLFVPACVQASLGQQLCPQWGGSAGPCSWNAAVSVQLLLLLLLPLVPSLCGHFRPSCHAAADRPQQHQGRSAWLGLMLVVVVVLLQLTASV